MICCEIHRKLSTKMTMLILIIAALWTVCSAKQYHDYYYQPFNVSRSTPSGIAAYRSALTLDWLAAEDSRQRELVAAIESEPLPPSRISNSDCISYNRPASGTVARLMLEVLKNLEGDEGMLVHELIQGLVRAKLLVLEPSMFDHEPDFEALVKTPTAMIGEPHITFPRIIATIWMAVTDPSTVKKHGWCTVNKMTTFLQGNRPRDIAHQMRVMDQIISRCRYIMEEFIQHVTPLNMMQDPVPSSTHKLMPRAKAIKVSLEEIHSATNKRPVAPHPEVFQLQSASTPQLSSVVTANPALRIEDEMSRDLMVMASSNFLQSHKLLHVICLIVLVVQ